MPGWLSSLVGELKGGLSWIIGTTIGRTQAWINWVDSTLKALSRFSIRTYILLTWDLANFSFYVASFAASVRKRIDRTDYVRLPNALRTAEKYTIWRVHREWAWRRAEVAYVRRELLNYITIVALNLANTIKKDQAYDAAQRQALKVYLINFIDYINTNLQALIAKETAARKAAINNLRKYLVKIIAALQAQVNAIIPTVDKSAATGYNSQRSDRGNILTKVIGDLATDNPLVKDLIGQLVQLILDLIEVDDPLARLAAKLLLTQVIDRLGVDKLAGGLAGDLAALFLGGGPPSTLQGVESDVASRLNIGEAQWQQFYANGGDDVENLGTQMRESASLEFLIPMAAWFAAAVTDPAGTAEVTDAVVGPLAQAAITPLIDLLSL